MEKKQTVSQYLKTIPTGEPVPVYGDMYVTRKDAYTSPKIDLSTCCCLCGRAGAKHEIYVTHECLAVESPTVEEEAMIWKLGSHAGYRSDDIMMSPIGSDCLKKLQRRGLAKPNKGIEAKGSDDENERVEENP